jgi:hypothetical protein
MMGPRLRDGILASTVFLLLYLATLSQNLSLAHDGARYINQIDRGASLWHPHHLFYAPLASLWIRTLRGIGICSDSSLLVGALNAIAGALALFLFHQLVATRIGLSRRGAIAATACVGLSFGLWCYSVCVEVYLPPLALLLLSLSLLCGRRPGTWAIAGAATAHAAAVLLHQMNVLFLPVAAVAGLQNVDRAAWTRGAAVYAAIFLAIVGATYLVVGFAVTGAESLAAWWSWTTTQAQHAGFRHELSGKSLLAACVGLGRAFVGGHFVFSIPVTSSIVKRLYPSFELRDESFLVRHMEPVDEFEPRATPVRLLAGEDGATLLSSEGTGPGASPPGSRSLSPEGK